MRTAGVDGALPGPGIRPCAVATRLAVSHRGRAGAPRAVADRPYRRARQRRHRPAHAARAGEGAWRRHRGGGSGPIVQVARFDSGKSRMSFADIGPGLQADMPELRGRLLANQSLKELTWFRVGGSAQLLFMPEDEADLCYFVAHLSGEIAVTVIGLGSNLIVRDGGVPGAVIRLGRGFGDIALEGPSVRAGAAVPDVKVARAAQEAGIDGLSFLRGIPGCIGGVLRMNGGAYGRETKDALV